MRGFFGLVAAPVLIIVPFLTMRLIAEERAQGTSSSCSPCRSPTGRSCSASTWRRWACWPCSASDHAVCRHGGVAGAARQGRHRRCLLRHAAHVRRLRRHRPHGFGIHAQPNRRRVDRALHRLRALHPRRAGSHLARGARQRRQRAVHPDALPIIARGVIDSRDVLYFATLSSGCLLVAQASLESRRWR